MIRRKNLTLSVLAALGIGLASPVIAGSGYGHPASGATSSLETSSDAAYFSAASAEGQREQQFGGEAAVGIADAGAPMVFDGAGNIVASDATGAADQGQYAEYVVVAEPSLVFSDGVWYSFADGEWFAMDEAGAWYSLADSTYVGSDEYAVHGSDAEDALADASDVQWYYVDAAPQHETTLYSNDGIAWYSMDGELVALAPVEVTEEASATGPIASSDAIGSMTYYYFL